MSDSTLSSNPLCAPTKEELIQFLTAWEGVGQLQTFTSREKFRKEARYFIQRLGLPEPPKASRDESGWLCDRLDRINQVCASNAKPADKLREIELLSDGFMPIPPPQGDAVTKSSALPLDDPSYVMEPGEHR